MANRVSQIDPRTFSACFKETSAVDSEIFFQKFTKHRYRVRSQLVRYANQTRSLINKKTYYSNKIVLRIALRETKHKVCVSLNLSETTYADKVEISCDQQK